MRLHKGIIRVITKSPFNSDSQSLFKNMGLLDLSQIGSYQIGEFMFKNLCNLLPQVFTAFSLDICIRNYA